MTAIPHPWGSLSPGFSASKTSSTPLGWPPLGPVTKHRGGGAPRPSHHHVWPGSDPAPGGGAQAPASPAGLGIQGAFPTASASGRESPSRCHKATSCGPCKLWVTVMLAGTQGAQLTLQSLPDTTVKAAPPGWATPKGLVPPPYTLCCPCPLPLRGATGRADVGVPQPAQPTSHLPPTGTCRSHSSPPHTHDGGTVEFTLRGRSRLTGGQW